MKYLIALGALIGLAVAYWLVAPLFIDSTVDEMAPVAVPGTGASSTQAAQTFPITGTAGHSASGDVSLISTDSGAVVRYENYQGTNGPDLFVYLAKDLDAREFVSLGRSKGNIGNANYEVPADVAVADYNYVLTWCKTFGVLFDYAEIN